MDDFRAWLMGLGPSTELCDSVAEIDPILNRCLPLGERLTEAFAHYFVPASRKASKKPKVEKSA